MDKKLTLSPTNKVIAGVCGGFSEYFKVDASFIRIAWVLGAIMFYVAPAVILYIACWAIMPLVE